MAISIANLDHVVLRVADLDRAQSFYERVLGCRTERTVDSIPLIQMRAGSSLIDLMPRGGEVAEPNMDHFCISVSPWDEDAIRAHLAANGVDAPETARRYGAEGTGPSIYIRDPDGNTVELKGPPDEPVRRP
jgi:glyoxylase I family protein